MHPTNRRANRDRATRRTTTDLPDGVGGTITGGPTRPIDLTEILTRDARGVAGAGAVSGAAQAVSSSFGPARGALNGRPHGIALSDGSRISFASIADAGVLNEDEDGDAQHLADAGARGAADVGSDGASRGASRRALARGAKSRHSRGLADARAGLMTPA